MSIYGIYGSSGFGREVLPLLKMNLNKNPTNSYEIYFIDDSIKNSDITLTNNTQTINYETFLNLDSKDKHVTIAIADYKIREQLTKKCENDKIILNSLFADNALILDEVEIGEGSIICPFSMITSNVKIGKGFQNNIYSYVAHDCIIGDFVTFAPSVKCNGNIIIEDYAYIGTGAILRQGTPDKPLRIGKGAVVGAGAIVLKDVPENTVVIGSPAKPLVK